MRNPFTKKNKTLPISVKSINKSFSGNINNLPNNLTPIIIGSNGNVGIGVQGVTGTTGVIGPIGVQGVTGYSYASASTFTYMDPEEIMKRRKVELMKEFEQNPELFSEIIVELRQRKIRQLKEKSTHQ
jgi:hypothetical protein